MILSKQQSCVNRTHFATFGKPRNAAPQKNPCAPLTLFPHLSRNLR